MPDPANKSKAHQELAEVERWLAEHRAYLLSIRSNASRAYDRVWKRAKRLRDDLAGEAASDA